MDLHIQTGFAVAVGGVRAVEKGTGQRKHELTTEAKDRSCGTLRNKVAEVVLIERAFGLNHLCIHSAQNGA